MSPPLTATPETVVRRPEGSVPPEGQPVVHPATTVATAQVAAPVITSTGANRGDGGDLGIQLRPSQMTAAPPAAAMTLDDNPHLLKYVTRKFEWKGEKYKLTIYLPVDVDKRTMSETERLQFDGEAEMLGELMIAEAKNQLNAQGEIRPGDNCKIYFENDKMVITDESVDYDSLDSGDEATFKEKKAFVAKGDSAAALAFAASTGDAGKMKTALSVDALKPLRETVSKERAQRSVTAGPVNLVNRGNSCFINAPFQQLVNDPNPEVIQALENPKYFIGGSSNPLFRAIQAYRQHQQSGKSGSLDIASILEINDRIQSDALLDAQARFEEFFDMDAIPAGSPLNELLDLTPHVLSADEEESLDAIAAERAGAANAATSENLPDEISVYTPRLTYEASEELLSGKTPLDVKKQFLQDLGKLEMTEEETALLTETLGDALYGDEVSLDKQTYNLLRDQFPEDTQRSRSIRQALSKYYHLYQLGELDGYEDFNAEEASDADINAMAAQILDNPVLDSALELLTPKQKAAIHAIRAKTISVVKNDSPITVNEDGTAALTAKDGSKKTYDLTSIAVHVGKKTEKGHYVTYVRKGNQCWILNDLKDRPTPISLKDFVAAARTSGCKYTLHKQGLLAVSTTTATEGGSKPAEKDSFKVDPDLSAPPTSTKKSKKDDAPEQDYLSTTVEVGTCSSMKDLGSEFALVNPSDNGLQYIHPQLEDVVDQTQIKTAITANSHWYQRDTYKPRYGTGPDMLVSTTKGGRKIIHIPLDDKISNKQNEMNTIIEDILEFAMKHKISHLAIPVIKTGDQPATVVNNMKLAIQKFVNANKQKWRGGHIRIVMTPEMAPAKPAVKPSTTKAVEDDESDTASVTENETDTADELEDETASAATSQQSVVMPQATAVF